MKNPNTEKGQTILYTRQDIKSLDEIEQFGRFINKKEYIEKNYGDIADYFIELYRWFVDVAAEIVPLPEDVEFPVWCAVDFKSCMKPIENTVVYKIKVPDEEIIYFDGSKWDYVLNHHYVPQDRDDLENYYADLRKKGLMPLVFKFFEKSNRNFHPLEYKKIIDSKKNIFIIKEWNIYSVQGNIWEIKKEWIQEVIPYENKSACNNHTNSCII